MLTQETQKRIVIIVLVILASLGALFVFFAIILNRSAITVVSEPPFSLYVKNLKTLNCTVPSCTVSVAPGEYTIVLNKEGYREESRLVQAPIFGQYSQEIRLSYIPSIRLVSDTSVQEKFGAIAKKSEITEDRAVFYERGGRYAVSLEKDAKTGRQFLYYMPIDAGVPGGKSTATSFIRDINAPLIFSDIDLNGDIAVIDHSDSGANLYMVNVKEKTRESLFDYLSITDVRWLPGGKDFIFEALEAGKSFSGIYIYRAETKERIETGIQTGMDNVIVLDANTLIAITGQPADVQSVSENTDGKMVVLHDKISDIQGEESVPMVIRYSLVNREARLISSIPGVALPDSAVINEENTGIYMLADNQVYELIFAKK